MKKVLSFMLLCFALVPAIFFTGCGSSESAKAVKNKTYYVTSALKSTTDITEECANANFKISFFTDHFKVEYGSQTESATYGYYLGTYETSGNKITLSITEYGGTFTDYESSTSTQEKIFSTFTYSKGTLRTEFVVGSNVMQYKLDLPEEN